MYEVISTTNPFTKKEEFPTLKEAILAAEATFYYFGRSTVRVKGQGVHIVRKHRDGKWRNSRLLKKEISADLQKEIKDIVKESR